MGNLKEINESEFEQVVLKNDKLVIVDFWAEWCSPCIALNPSLEKLQKNYEDKLLVVKLNVDYNPNIAAKYQITSIPRLLFFKDGQDVDELIGLRPYKKIEEKALRYIEE